MVMRRTFARVAAVAAILIGSSLFAASPANAAALVCTGPASTQRSISIYCDGTRSGNTEFRVAAEFCSGTGCTTRYGAYVKYNSGNLSTASSASLYFSGYYTLQHR